MLLCPTAGREEQVAYWTTHTAQRKLNLDQERRGPLLLLLTKTDDWPRKDYSGRKWQPFNIEQFTSGCDLELQHGPKRQLRRLMFGDINVADVKAA